LSVLTLRPSTTLFRSGRGASGWYANDAVDAAGRRLAREVLDAAGLAIEVETEAQLDAVTGVSGSGPAYFFLLVEALGEAGAALELGSAYDGTPVTITP